MAEEQGARMVRGRYRPVLWRNELVSKLKGYKYACRAGLEQGVFDGGFEV